MTYTQIIALSFICVILIGTLLLSLPLSSRSNTWTNPADSLFTATSATCVTGLVVYDTYTHWSIFGQIVILVLIQVGGLGFMTLISMLSVFMRRKISLHERMILMQSAGTMRLSGVVVLLKRIVSGTFIFEAAGTAFLAIRFCPQMGFWKGLYNALFHSVSAFCNAGFDILGQNEPYSSFTGYADDALVNLTICSLIIIGGIGFFVWNDIVKSRFRFKRFEFHTKVVLTTTAVLLVGTTVLFYIFERNGLLSEMSEGNKWLTSFFGAVTPRTAGFNTIDYAKASESTNILTMVNMFIGGSPGSTAGGVKTTTIIIVIMASVAASRKNADATMFKRRFSSESIKRATSVVTIYLVAIIAGTMAICAIEPMITAKESIFECISAAGTVGLSLGITRILSPVSKIILMILMYGGRVGGLSLMLVLAENREQTTLRRPKGDIQIG